MYGIVNQAIQGLVSENFGLEVWGRVKEKSGIDIEVFLSNESYDDSITYKLAGAAAEVLGITVHDVLKAFGEYWILKTGKDNYGALLKSGGNNLKEFLINLPNFHSRVMLMYPELTPPEFKISEISDESLQVHYYSTREGLEGFVMGLLHGIAKMYQTEVNEIRMIESRTEGFDHEIFLVRF